MLKTKSFQCRHQLLEGLISMIFYIKEDFAPYCGKFMGCLMEYMKSTDPKQAATKRVAIDVVYSVGAHCSEEIEQQLPKLLHILDECRTDKNQPVRAASQETIKLLKELQRLQKEAIEGAGSTAGKSPTPDPKDGKGRHPSFLDEAEKKREVTRDGKNAVTGPEDVSSDALSEIEDLDAIADKYSPERKTAADRRGSGIKYLATEPSLKQGLRPDGGQGLGELPLGSRTQRLTSYDLGTAEQLDILNESMNSGQLSNRGPRDTADLGQLNRQLNHKNQKKSVVQLDRKLRQNNYLQKGRQGPTPGGPSPSETKATREVRKKQKEEEEVIQQIQE